MDHIAKLELQLLGVASYESLDDLLSVDTNTPTQNISHLSNRISVPKDKESQLDQIAGHPLFSDLRNTLQFECQAQDTIPTTLFESLGSTPLIPVSARSSQIHLRFMKLTGDNCLTLKTFYIEQSATLEMTRCSALSKTTSVWMQNSVNIMYDQQHHALLDRVGKSLELLEQQVQPPRKASSPPKIGNDAIGIMTSWYARNIDHPYPSHQDISIMASSGSISDEQVKKWFYNRRQRLGQTKSVAQIVQRRKRRRTTTTDDILLESAKLARLH